MHLTIIDCDPLECPSPIPILKYGRLYVVETDIAHCELLIPNEHPVLA